MVDIGFIAITLATAIWVGAIVFQSAVVAPSVFTTLDASDAGALLRNLFPRFFAAGLLCGAVMVVAVGLMVATGAGGDLVRIAGAIAVVMLALQFAASRMVPAINAARDAGYAGKRRFGRLHALNVVLTVLVLLLGLGLLGVLAVAAAGGRGVL